MSEPLPHTAKIEAILDEYQHRIAWAQIWSSEARKAIKEGDSKNLITALCHMGISHQEANAALENIQSLGRLDRMERVA